MRQSDEPLFLAKAVYRRRRLSDAAKILPILGIILLFLPILWAGDAETGSGIVYVFAAWFALIAIVWLVSTWLSKAIPETEEATGGSSVRDAEE